VTKPFFWHTFLEKGKKGKKGEKGKKLMSLKKQPIKNMLS